ncbi:zinc finger BED domain-containing protein 5 [Trichonephila clavipes]|nr:zinc finger BED domain-containing protein 5 [Trichonephila clavipes]
MKDQQIHRRAWFRKLNQSNKYSQKYLNFGFTTTEVNDGEKMSQLVMRQIYKSKKQHVKFVSKTMQNHLAMLAKNFKKYLLDEDNLVASYEWIRDLFQDTPEELSTSKEEIFIHFTSSENLKGNFVINRSLNFG